jgi:enterochelin esterase-like enzyme
MLLSCTGRPLLRPGVASFFKSKHMTILIRLLPMLFFVGLFSSCQNMAENKPQKGTLTQHTNFKSNFIGERNVDIYLPPGYDKATDQRYPVLYMHDGQNLFSTETGYGAQEWRMDENLDSLIQLGAIEPCIVVGPWNGQEIRFMEYMPQAPILALPDSVKAKLDRATTEQLSADQYLRFLTEELKPFIDKTYRTKTDKENTFISGSSMGGLISMYAMVNHPEIYGGAACLSTHWPISLDNSTLEVANAVVDYFGANLPSAIDHKLYFDYGTKGLDAYYEPYQQRMDDLVATTAYEEGKTWMTQKFEGDDHNEASWSRRVAIPLEFLLGKE